MGEGTGRKAFDQRGAADRLTQLRFENSSASGIPKSPAWLDENCGADGWGRAAC